MQGVKGFCSRMIGDFPAHFMFSETSGMVYRHISSLVSQCIIIDCDN